VNDKTALTCAQAQAVRGRLETLCRELQKSNRAITEENKRIQEAELKKREQLSLQFQGTINEITSRLEADEQVQNQFRVCGGQHASFHPLYTFAIPCV